MNGFTVEVTKEALSIAALFAAFSKAAKLAGHKRGLVTIGYNGTAAALVSIGKDDCYMGVLMSMRAPEPKWTCPKWMVQ